MTTAGQPDLVLWERTYPGDAAQVGNVRGDVRKHLDGCPVADDVIALVSELSANAILHSSSGQPYGTFTVRVQDFPGACVYAEVEDAGSSWHGDLARSAEPPHGLHMVQMLAATCGAELCARAHIVWFTVSYPQRLVTLEGLGESAVDPFQLAALQVTSPEFAFRIIDIAGKRSIDAIRVTGTGTLYSVITSDPAELWRILRFTCRNTNGPA